MSYGWHHHMNKHLHKKDHYNNRSDSEYDHDHNYSCGCVLTCNTQSLEQIKYQTLKHSSYYIGISKRMAYGQYIRTTPGMETFASKKIPVLQPLVNRNIKCFSSYWCKHL